MKRFLFVCVTVWALCSCSPKVTMNIIHKQKPVEYVEDVVILKEKEPLPDNAEWMGDIEVKGKANYNRMAEITRFRAWEKGANYVRVKSFGSDGVRSDIHVMKSDVYRADTAHHVAVPISTVASNSSYVNRGSTGAVSTNQTVTNNASGLDSEFESPNGLRFYTGYGRRLGKINPALNDFEKMHLKRMMSGVLLGADYVRYFNSSRTCGFGLRYQLMHTKSEDYASVTFDDGSPSLEGLLSDVVNISYVGPIYSKRSISKDGKSSFMYDVGLGLLFYKNTSCIADKQASVVGVTSGLTADVNYSYMLTDKLSIGANLSLTSGALSNYTTTDYHGNTVNSSEVSNSQAESLLQMGVSAQLIYTF